MLISLNNVPKIYSFRFETHCPAIHTFLVGFAIMCKQFVVLPSSALGSCGDSQINKYTSLCSSLTAWLCVNLAPVEAQKWEPFPPCLEVREFVLARRSNAVTQRPQK